MLFFVAYAVESGPEQISKDPHSQLEGGNPPLFFSTVPIPTLCPCCVLKLVFPAVSPSVSPPLCYPSSRCYRSAKTFQRWVNKTGNSSAVYFTDYSHANVTCVTELNGRYNNTTKSQHTILREAGLKSCGVIASILV